MGDSKIAARRDASGAVHSSDDAVAVARADAHRRLGELTAELDMLSTQPWQAHPSRAARVVTLKAERALLEARVWLDGKGAALEKSAAGVIEGSQQAMRRDVASRRWLGPVGEVVNAAQQVGASTFEGVVGVAAVAGQLAELGGFSRAEHALLHHPLETAATLGAAVVTHTQDVYSANGLGAALGDVATLGLAGVGEARLVGKALRFATKVTTPWPAAIAGGVHAATGLAADAALPAANVAVKVAVGGYVGKEAVKLVGTTAATEAVGNRVRRRTQGEER